MSAIQSEVCSGVENYPVAVVTVTFTPVEFEGLTAQVDRQCAIANSITKFLAQAAGFVEAQRDLPCNAEIFAYPGKKPQLEASISGLDAMNIEGAIDKVRVIGQPKDGVFALQRFCELEGTAKLPYGRRATGIWLEAVTTYNPPLAVLSFNSETSASDNYGSPRVIAAVIDPRLDMQTVRGRYVRDYCDTEASHALINTVVASLTQPAAPIAEKS